MYSTLMLLDEVVWGVLLILIFLTVISDTQCLPCLIDTRVIKKDL